MGGPQIRSAENPSPVKLSPFTGGQSDQDLAAEDEWGGTIRIGRRIHIPDNATDTSLFCLPVQGNGADGFKLALYLISRALEEVDVRIVHTLHDEIIVEARDGEEDQVQTIVEKSVEEALERIIPEVAFVAEPRIAGSWEG